MTVQLYGTFMYAQSDSYKKDLEPSVLECKYELVMQFDTVDVSLRKDMMILRMGENVSQFYAYSAFYSDSLTSTPQGKKRLRLNYPVHPANLAYSSSLKQSTISLYQQTVYGESI